MSIVNNISNGIVEFTSKNNTDDEVINKNILMLLSVDVKLEHESYNLFGDSYGVYGINNEFVYNIDILGDVFVKKICVRD